MQENEPVSGDFMMFYGQISKIECCDIVLTSSCVLRCYSDGDMSIINRNFLAYDFYVGPGWERLSM